MIDLGENRFTGEIPTWIGDSFLEVKVLILGSNEFYGSIPSSLCGLANAQVLDLSSNKISGVIPKCVHKYTAMTTTESPNSFLSEMSIIGYPTLDSWYIFETKSLERAHFMWKRKEINFINHLGLVKLIDLSSNNLVGEIPSEITKLVGLVGLNLSSNNLTGSIPQNIV
ncbi:hypothetical protein ACJIZ3_011118 [Penstemon smallii]|uniref:Uncharacterized protein n=1 Tax=Penstemon smallii TaxID=265156 RepID=A0ABD3UJW3_9LAMI